MTAKTKILLLGPAKIDGVWKKAGDEPEVDAVILQQLVDAGVVGVSLAVAAEAVSQEADANLIFTQVDFDAAVAIKAKEMAGAAFDGALAQSESEAKAIWVEAEKLEAEKAEAVARADKAEAALQKLTADSKETVDRLQARNAELEATISALTPPPAEPAPATKKPKGG